MKLSLVAVATLVLLTHPQRLEARVIKKSLFDSDYIYDAKDLLTELEALNSEAADHDIHSVREIKRNVSDVNPVKYVDVDGYREDLPLGELLDDFFPDYFY